MKIDREFLLSRKDELHIALKPYIIYRYEPLIDNGTVFIYNKRTGNIYTGNNLVYLVLKIIEEKRPTIESLLKEIQKVDSNLSTEEIIEFLIELYNRDMIVLLESTLN